MGALQSTSILSRTFTTSPGSCLSLRGNEFCQPLSIAQRWNRLRVGLFCAIADDASPGLNVYQAGLYVGLCTTYRPITSDTSNWLGWAFGNTTGNTWTYSANSGNPYFTCSAFCAMTRINGATNSSSTSSFSAIVPASTASAIQRRGMLFVDITKGATTFTVTGISTAAAHMTTDFSMEDFFYVAEQVNVAPAINGTALRLNSQSLAMTETPATQLTNLCLWWSKWRFAFEIYALVVYQVN